MKLLISLSLVFLVNCSNNQNQTCGLIRYDLPIVFNIHSSFPTEHLPELQRAMNTWNSIVGKELFKIGETVSGPLFTRQDKINVVYWYRDSWDRNPKEQAMAASWFSGNVILESDIKMNAYNFSFGENGVDLESLLLHELGHTIGLQHLDSEPSVMSTYLRVGEIRRTLHKADLDAIGCRYK